MMTGLVFSVTVKLALQVTKFPDKSVTVLMIGVTPVETNVPAGGDWVMMSDPAGVQLSEAITPEVKSGTAAWQFPFADAV
jgi:hypothetical protein